MDSHHRSKEATSFEETEIQARSWIETEEGIKVRCADCGMYVLTREIGEHRRIFHSTNSGSVAQQFEKGRHFRKTLRSFGIKAFRDGQEEAIHAILDGFDTLVVLPTGTGKSLIYQVAALHRPGVTLVISPLIALMKDQVDKLQGLGIPATFINRRFGSKWTKTYAKLSRNVMGAVRMEPDHRPGRSETYRSG